MCDAAQTEDDRLATTTPSTVVDSEDARESARPVQNIKEKEQGMITPVPTSDTIVLAVAPHDVQQHMPIEDIAAIKKAKQTQLSQLSEGFNTQSSNIPEMKYALKTMMQPEHITQGDTQTQWFPLPPRTESTEAPELGDESPARTTEPPSPVKGTKPVLSQSVAKVLEDTKSDLRQAALKLAKEEGSRKKASDLILCHCECTQEEGDMVSCPHLVLLQ